MATLAMIEQPKTTIVEGSRYSIDESDPDAPLEKARLIDEEVTVIREEPVTSKIRKTIRLLHSVGGFRARFRGLGVSIFYHAAHAFTANLINTLTLGNLFFGVFGYLVASLALARIHMTWTHIMISQPSEKPWYRRIPNERKIWKALALPSLVFAVAQQLTFALPVGVFFVLGLHRTEDLPIDGHEMSNCARSMTLLKFLAIPVTALAVALLILLPASVTLTRIEASMLPEDQETIVNFDRTLNGAVVSPIALGRGEAKTLFIEAWRSFDRAARIRLIKLYAKLFAIQAMVVIIGLHVIVSEFFFLGFERLTTLAASSSAQLQLQVMGAPKST